MAIRGVGTNDGAVEVDDGGGSESVEFCRLRRKGRSEEGGDEQTNKAVGKVIENEVDEDVVRVVGVERRIRSLNHSASNVTIPSHNIEFVTKNCVL